MNHAVEQNGIVIVRTPTGLGVAWKHFPPPQDRPIAIEVDYRGRRLYQRPLHPLNDLPWRDYYEGVDMLACAIRVRDGERILAELPVDDAPMPFMVLQGEQRHITESYVSVPPALTITDERGDVWTLGFAHASPEQTPRGEFAFNVLKNGANMGEMASRIERRAGKVRIWTRHGWKNWNGTIFI